MKTSIDLGHELPLKKAVERTKYQEQALENGRKIIKPKEDLIKGEIEIFTDHDLEVGYEKASVLYKIAFPFMCFMMILGVLQTLFYLALGKKKAVKERRLPKNPGLFWSGLSSSCKRIREHVATHRALDVVYFFEKIIPTLKGLDKWVSVFWLKRVMINTKAVRNRLKLVHKALLQQVIDYSQETGKKEINLLSVACGSAPAVFEVAKKFQQNGIRLSVTLLDLDEEALEYCANMADEIGIQVTLVNASTRSLSDYFRREQFDIVEMVGFLDYRNHDQSMVLLTNIRNLLKKCGRLLTANIVWNSEVPFMNFVVSWPMNYKKPVTLAAIGKAAGFRETKVIVEPIGIHAVAICKK
ncbi:MAG: hypothetical protein A3B74_02925 [Candidatus Kerfeldbacteria bacterium RIFCSPHIGHO2_02_FULL_42_14]|uniref:Methyltransferase domain-containing protein n=1 Tax=Candidatus Kerfeldbacteria bacterium RIFCSPHIGHO2_02_FULL_42_14 TaxID=1798540 RepID=A0A1G2ATQ4_9BACT|nr:MAG: hypothetical protein A3B74_02925 [Candidatus Kerfeldbacteria bacterium RIFCSPHIGHO2_02_FULL_42_14]OGY82364.1 MAG: hypothetical protein A3E60_00315 [Candidatus Kerfeldbacteria bacterium RIFCSPHIGHO2_12_FULL_42_13]OGY84596.1 MAG: hypothetical protein A3I91_01235 [Candidatus Kerfeldbacteria bacterium RIFCSPLOWO2_02_FULL_42_19]OGY87095.1 MAG: hypothetical protein A3G01_04310 [Candidatus Kerfeldbacteria bacterium RIFCSPLOWO2_12_FULL_43_9]